MTKTKKQNCPVCGSADVELFFSVEQLPSLSCALWPSSEASKDCPKGDITLSGCDGCGFIENSAFDPKLTEYDATYENALHFSPVYRDYAEREARNLIERHGLRGKRIVEIGCGDGQFLSMLCEIGNNTGSGYDPSFVADPGAVALHADVSIETRYYTEADARETLDLLLCRQVLEHIPNPAGFMGMLHRGLGHQAGVLLSFEVPNAEYLIKDLSVWDLIYEHCTYFTPSSLQTLFERSGFRVHDIRSGFGGQNLTIEASPIEHPEPQPPSAELTASIEGNRANIGRFSDEATARILHWSEWMREQKAAGQRIALWGAGARGAMFLNMVESANAVGMVVDINPRKHGSYLPGTGHEICEPSALSGFEPEIVLTMNPNYRAEVQRSVADLGVTAELLIP